MAKLQVQPAVPGGCVWARGPRGLLGQAGMGGQHCLENCTAHSPSRAQDRMQSSPGASKDQKKTLHTRAVKILPTLLPWLHCSDCSLAKWCFPPQTDTLLLKFYLKLKMQRHLGETNPEHWLAWNWVRQSECEQDKLSEAKGKQKSKKNKKKINNYIFYLCSWVVTKH